jgi:hypothetical protein
LAWNPYVGTIGSGIFVWGAQLEAGSAATSYIPTTSAVAIRAADSCTLGDQSFYNIYNRDEGTIIADFTPISLNTSQGFYAIHGDIRQNGGHSAYTTGLNNSINAESYTTLYTPTIQSTRSALSSNRIKIAHGYKSDDAVIMINGTSPTSSLTYTPPTDMTGLALGANGFSDSPSTSNVIISDFKLYRKRINNDLIRIYTTL